MNRRAFLKTCGGGLAATVAASGAEAASLTSENKPAAPVAGKDAMPIFDLQAMGDYSRIVAMIAFEDSVFVATEHRIYRLRRDVADPKEFTIEQWLLGTGLPAHDYLDQNTLLERVRAEWPEGMIR